MWASALMLQAIDMFTGKDAIAEGLYELLPQLVEETPACTGDFGKAAMPTGREVVRSFQAFADLLRELDRVKIMQDRLHGYPQRSRLLFDACYDSIQAHGQIGVDDETHGKLTILSWTRLLFVRAIICYESGVMLWALADDLPEPDQRQDARNTAGKFFCTEACMAFERVIDDLVEAEAISQSIVKGDLASAMLHTVLGLGKEKLFRAVMAHASGKSPHQDLANVQRALAGVRVCQDKAEFFRDAFLRDADLETS